MSTALLFPGQGSPLDGMRELAERHEPDLLRVAAEAVGQDPFDEAQRSTASAQPAIVVASLALWSAAGSPSAELAAGHSLGELTALCVAGAIAPGDAVRLAAARGRAMQEAADSKPGAMAALIGDARAALDAADDCGAQIVNFNSPKQHVAAGPVAAIDKLETSARDAGLRAMRLQVAGAFHTGSMEPAVAAFRAALDRTDIDEMRATVYSCSDAAPFPSDAGGIRRQLADAVTRPVRWQETVEALHDAGAHRFAETGPGKALTGMVKRIVSDADATALGAEEPAHA